MARTLPTSAEVREYHKSLSNWGRWGADDQLGAMNLITPEKRLQAVSLVEKGISVTMGRPIIAETTADGQVPPTLHMLESGEGWNTTPGKPEQASHSASEYIGFIFHGYVMTHVDALSHWFDGDKMYNGHPADAVRTRGGATMESIDLLKDGVVTRAVLFDFPTLKGVDYMDAGEAIFPEDLDAAYADLVDKGVRFATSPQVTWRGPGRYWRAAIFYDPDGFDLALFKMYEGEPAETVSG